MRSYFDIMTELRTMIQEDNIPKGIKTKILKTLDKLFELLWPYSD